jgi:ppGpp synthetase/RelA/SpoT-type nucleotidyltranferase
MIGQSAFLTKYNFTNQDFEKSRLVWDELIRIYDDYNVRRPALKHSGTLVESRLKLVPEVHFASVRTKEPEALVAKIIRKCTEDQNRNINFENYRQEITDLVGVRAVHLFKDDWLPIHDFVIKTWKMVEPPTANVRDGDSKKLINDFEQRGCNIYPHPFGYRSVHYSIEFQPDRESCIVEIQVRTIFEEGWSEIDHLVRYPRYTDNPVINHFLVLFNRLAGASDEMGSFVRVLQLSEISRDNAAAEAFQKRSELVDKIRERIRSVTTDGAMRDELLSALESLSRISAKELYLLWSKMEGDVPEIRN